MSTRGSLRIERPYGSADEYLAGDAWTVDRTEMLLVGAGSVAAGTLVTFEIVLTSGEAVVQGEGRVIDPVAEPRGRPGGLRVRFLKLDPGSKAMLRRALDVQKRSPAPAQTAVEVAPPLVSVETAAVADAEPERSGVRHRAASPIVAPGNRDALLARLRERAPGAGAQRRTAGE